MRKDQSTLSGWRGWLLVIVLASLWGGAGSAYAADRHIGYYYPKLTSQEVYVARARTLVGANKQRRLGFVTLMTNRMVAARYAPQFLMFAKGEQSEKLIIVGMGDHVQNLYQGRAVLAMLTAQARKTPIFKEFGVEDVFTFFDLLHMMGFQQLTITDGRHFAHQVVIKPRQ